MFDTYRCADARTLVAAGMAPWLLLLLLLLLCALAAGEPGLGQPSRVYCEGDSIACMNAERRQDAHMCQLFVNQYHCTVVVHKAATQIAVAAQYKSGQFSQIRSNQNCGSGGESHEISH